MQFYTFTWVELCIQGVVCAVYTSYSTKLKRDQIDQPITQIIFMKIKSTN